MYDAWFYVWDFTRQRPSLLGFVHLTQPEEFGARNSKVAFEIALRRFSEIEKLGVAATTKRRVQEMQSRLINKLEVLTK